MKKYDELFNALFFNVFKFQRLNQLNVAVEVFVIILMLPIITLHLAITAVFKVLLYLNVLLAIPSDYFNSVFEASNKIASAPLFVVYLVAYPFKFTVDAAISINLIFMSFIFTLFQLVSYLVSLGQTKLELYLTYATPNSLKSDNKEIALWLQIVTLVLMIVSLLSLIVMSLFIFYPEYIVVFIWPAINFIFIIPTVIMFNINLKPAKKVQKIVTT
jgi:hypothetical protein